MKNFKHMHAAHCESGVVSSLLTHQGLKMSEAMAFGIGNGMTFAYLPMIKLDGMPLIAYRMPPKHIIKTITKRLGLTLKINKYKCPKSAKNELIKMLEEGKLVGLQTSVYWLPYFPQDMRFHFNAHNLLVYGIKNNKFLISDPVFDKPQEVGIDELDKARFARGVFAPNGACYTIENVPQDIDLKNIIKKSIKRTSGMMLYNFIPWIGINGMKSMKKAILKLKKNNDKRYRSLYLGHIIRMQEEIGTGGGGFRLMYAAFLSESAELFNSDELHKASAMMTDAGDAWRMFAFAASKACKRKDYPLEDVISKLDKAIEKEYRTYKFLRSIKL